MTRRRTSSKIAALEKYDHLLTKTILSYQDPVTGLLPPFITKDGVVGGKFAGHAWVRDNVYCVLSIWGMALAYKSNGEGDEDRQRAIELEKSAVKVMRSVLLCMLRQVSKVEMFKKTLKREFSLHAKYNMKTCGTVVGDHEWGHLQIDATSLFLLILAQMTASGLQVIYTLDEVSFVQNLIFYIETAYRTPDYGIWERGDKTNHGQTELNSTSIGMAKAALEAMSGLDLFGAQGGPSSVIHVLADQVAQCNAKLTSLLPRESSSKEIDAGLLTIIGFPAFSVENNDLILETKQQIQNKLQGMYGCRRFLRDGYHTVRENSTRLHYELAELKIFENIECEWPLFFIYFLIDAIINGDQDEIKLYREKLEQVVIHKVDGLVTVPELYLVPWEFVNAEYHKPHSQKRKIGHKIQSMWPQSLYILAGLLEDGLVNIGEIDPLNRRLSIVPRPDPLVQVVLLAEDAKLCRELAQRGIPAKTFSSLIRDKECPVKVLPAKLLGQAYNYLGQNRKMGLSGRFKKEVGVLSTSMLYSVRESIYAFYPSFLDHEAFYLCLDNELLVDLIGTDIAYLKSNWRLMGCPLMTLPILRTMVGEATKWDHSPVFKLLLRLKSGYMAGVRVQLGNISDFISTSCLVHMTFMEAAGSLAIWEVSTSNRVSRRSFSILPIDELKSRPRTLSSGTSPVAGAVKRSRVTPAASPSTPTETKPDPKFSISSLGVQFAKGWSSRRHSFGGGKHLPVTADKRTSSFMNAQRRELAAMASLNVQDLLNELSTTDDVYDQADILNFLFDRYGKDYDTQIGGHSCTVEMLLEELYEKVGYYRNWSLVRHSAGMLKKQVDDIAQVVTDLLVRQKTISIGQPNKEVHITQPLPLIDLMDYIFRACDKDHTAVAVTQEILVFLAMFIRSEPHLFHEMLRLRIGLIQNVMVTELSRSLHCTNDDGVDRLLDLGPFELKNLLHHILSRKEFTIDQILNKSDNDPVKQLSIITPSKRFVSGRLQEQVKALEIGEESEEEEKQGQWRRRRRIDGALNRVPPEFYNNVWHTLEKCEGLFIGNQLLPKNPTVHEMTPGELKFALRVESVLNSLPDPEYRQLIVEVIMIIAHLVHHNPQLNLSQIINIDNIIISANNLFIEDQKANNGLALNCCCEVPTSCEGYAGVCVYFYDSAPSGVYGTMSYLSRALVQKFGQLMPDQSCRVS